MLSFSRCPSCNVAEGTCAGANSAPTNENCKSAQASPRASRSQCPTGRPQSPYAEAQQLRGKHHQQADASQRPWSERWASSARRSLSVHSAHASTHTVYPASPPLHPSSGASRSSGAPTAAAAAATHASRAFHSHSAQQAAWDARDMAPSASALVPSRHLRKIASAALRPSLSARQHTQRSANSAQRGQQNTKVPSRGHGPVSAGASTAQKCLPAEVIRVQVDLSLGRSAPHVGTLIEPRTPLAWRLAAALELCCVCSACTSFDAMELLAQEICSPALVETVAALLTIGEQHTLLLLDLLAYLSLSTAAQGVIVQSDRLGKVLAGLLRAHWHSAQDGGIAGAAAACTATLSGHIRGPAWLLRCGCSVSLAVTRLTTGTSDALHLLENLVTSEAGLKELKNSVRLVKHVQQSLEACSLSRKGYVAAVLLNTLV